MVFFISMKTLSHGNHKTKAYANVILGWEHAVACQTIWLAYFLAEMAEYKMRTNYILYRQQIGYCTGEEYGIPWNKLANQYAIPFHLGVCGSRENPCRVCILNRAKEGHPY